MSVFRWINHSIDEDTVKVRKICKNQARVLMLRSRQPSALLVKYYIVPSSFVYYGTRVSAVCGRDVCTVHRLVRDLILCIICTEVRVSYISTFYACIISYHIILRIPLFATLLTHSPNNYNTQPVFGDYEFSLCLPQ